MKQLVCEMCGSTDLIKQDGVFVCQTCGCKYSVEEAKKMMVEGTVQVEGTVKVDASAKLENLYTLARRAKAEDNYENAAKYYSQIVVEDPESWEAAFYSVYYTALNCRIGQIPTAANSIAYCLESVMNLIKKNVPENEQKNAYTEVATRAALGGTLLFNASKNTYLESTYSNRLNDFHDRAGNALFAVASAGIMVVHAFDDVLLAKTIYDGGLALCESFGPAKAYSKLFHQYLSEIEPRIASAQEKRNREYWEQHKEERQNLLEEKQSIMQQISDLNDKISSFTESEEILGLKKELARLSGQKASFGLFKVKEKKMLQMQIDGVNAKLKPLLDEQAQSKAALKEQVDALRGQLRQISDELEKAR